MSRASIGVATATVLVLFLSACTSSVDGKEVDVEEVETVESPLAPYMDAIYGGYTEEAWAEQYVVAELAAKCMADEGFEYIPPNPTPYEPVTPGESWEPENEEWVAQYGWGIVNSPGDDQLRVIDDPNQDYVMALSQAEQAAYYETLYGVPPTEEEWSAGTVSWEDEGCYGAASHEVQGHDVQSDEKYKSLLESMNKIYENVQNDPRIVEANATWASCMADAGHSGFANPQAAQDQFMEELIAQREAVEADGGLKLKELGAREIEMALADLACAKEADSRQLALTVKFELEEQFVADNKSELDAALAEAEQGK